MPNYWLCRRTKRMRVMINTHFLADMIIIQMNGRGNMLGLRALLAKDMLEGILFSANLPECALKTASEELADSTISFQTRTKTLINKLAMT